MPLVKNRRLLLLFVVVGPREHYLLVDFLIKLLPEPLPSLIALWLHVVVDLVGLDHGILMLKSRKRKSPSQDRLHYWVPTSHQRSLRLQRLLLWQLFKRLVVTPVLRLLTQLRQNSLRPLVIRIQWVTKPVNLVHRIKLFGLFVQGLSRIVVQLQFAWVILVASVHLSVVLFPIIALLALVFFLAPVLFSPALFLAFQFKLSFLLLGILVPLLLLPILFLSSPSFLFFFLVVLIPFLLIARLRLPLVLLLFSVRSL